MSSIIYANKERPAIDYSTLLDEVLIHLRRELRSDLHIISEIDWGEKESEAIIEEPLDP